MPVFETLDRAKSVGKMSADRRRTAAPVLAPDRALSTTCVRPKWGRAGMNAAVLAANAGAFAAP